MKRIFVIMLWLNTMVYFPTISYGGAAAETAGQILAKLSKLPPENGKRFLSRKPKARDKYRFIARCRRSRSIRLSSYSANAIRSSR